MNDLNLVETAADGTATTTSLVVANGTESQHRAVLQLIKNNMQDFEEFGPIAFEMRKGAPLPQGGFAKSTNIAILNREHAMLLMTYMRNTAIVRDFKKRLIHAFVALEQKAQTPVAALPDRRALAQMVLEAEDRADKATAELEAAAPAIEYHDRFIADDQDVITVEDWGRQWGLSRPQAFDLLTGRKVIFRKSVTREFSNKAGQVVDRNEYRPYSDYRNLFDLRPQHNAPRYHNGQVRQTLYVKASGSFLLANAMKLPGTPGGEKASA